MCRNGGALASPLGLLVASLIVTVVLVPWLRFLHPSQRCFRYLTTQKPWKRDVDKDSSVFELNRNTFLRIEKISYASRINRV